MQVPGDALALVFLGGEQLLAQHVDLAIGAGDVGDVLMSHHQQRFQSKREPSHPQLLDAGLAFELHLIGAFEILELARHQGRQAGPQRLRNLGHRASIQTVGERHARQPGAALGFEYVALAGRIDGDGGALGVDDGDAEGKGVQSRLQKPLASVRNQIRHRRWRLAVGR